MTQQQKTAPRALPTCPAGHPARYIHDLRREGAGGGHLIECRCSTTAKHPSFDLAWAHWHKQHGLQPTVAAVEEALPSNVLQMKLFAAGRA
ncbi:TPA: hypothetical protein ACGCGJ_000799 [Stenotrophomonas maltophilia]|uniref:hypothetical protein n=1 Tax=Stenotrophomonas maltophilia TaxID=40324 RepID=UPI00131196E5|nr:hypothetical protein [Stenotrophomonas maltophilia]MBH1493774.1 hypothetical protein [Stenotrophomonas maltophilia]MBN4961250.1 hypothetical protein [Stenotrophomonas maltophilia]MCO7494956.1 hypothetical protein [Stenotrophomonas maltophilia]NRP01839.1 hypothetical protein [Stenotrophomonas maltophilia]